MKIGIDCRTILNPGYGENAGVGHYTFYLVKNLLKVDKKNKYILFFDNLLSKNAAEKIVSGSVNAEIRFFPFHNYKKYLPLAFSHILVTMALEKEKLDIYHSPAYVLPLTYKGKSVVTVHDLAIYKHPEWFPSKFLVGQNFSTKTLLPKSLVKSEKIIAVSENTKKDIIKLFEINPGKVKVVYEGVNVKDLPAKEESVCGLGDKICFEDIRLKYGLKEDYILFLGTIEPRKNILALVKEFCNLASRDKRFLEKYQLVLAGAKGWKYEKIFSEIESCIKKSKHKNIIKYVGYVPSRDKFFLMKYAACFAFPSLYEGFGLPVLEAMSLGVPTITSKISSLPEIAGESAILIDPERPEELGRALEKILSDSNLRADLSKKGISRARRFSWGKCAKETIEVYKEAIK